MENYLKKVSIRATSLLLFFSLILPSTVALSQNTNTDYYYEGRAQAQIDYDGDGAMIGGLGSGLILGLIGWGLGYLIVSSQNIDVPYQYVSDLDTTQRMKFEKGYKDQVKETKKSKFNMGGGIGTLLAVAFVLGTAE